MQKLIILTMLFLSGCIGLNLHIEDNNPYKSFVRLTRVVHTVTCKEVVQGVPECVELQPTTFHASGVIVGENEDSTYILTAGHFCHEVGSDINKLRAIFSHNKIPPDAWYYFEDATHITNLIVNDWKGNNYFSTMIIWDSVDTDLCLVQTDTKMNYRPLQVSDSKPKLGERLFMASAPLGLHQPGMVIILDGFYSGEIWHPFFDKPSTSITDFPILPGSSGAGILNEKGEIVSIAMATNMHFPHDGYGVTLEQIKDFLKENLDIKRNRFREWFNGLFN